MDTIYHPTSVNLVVFFKNNSNILFTLDKDQKLNYNWAQTYCPNSFYPNFWKGPSIPCIIANKSIGECPFSSSEKRIKYATNLTCTDKNLCLNTSTYYLTSLPIRTHDTGLYFEENGFTSTPIIEKTNENKFKFGRFNAVPFHRLFEIFFVKDQVKTNDPQCGYWFLPYEIVDKLSSLDSGFNNRIIAMLFDIVFDDKSMVGHISNSKKQKLVKSSIKELEPRYKSTINL